MSAEKTKGDTDQAVEQETDRAKEQAESSIVEPVRAYGALTTDYYEELFSTQFDAVRTFADTTLAQSRSWLDVKDLESFRQVVEEQQQAIQEMSERLKSDADKISTLSQEYMKEAQQLATESVQEGQKQFQDNMQKGQRQLKEGMQKGKEQVEDGKQKGKQQSEETLRQVDKNKKPTSTINT